MSTITVSSKYQIVIPSKIREALGIKRGEKL
jgi:AbrB family looped-hinge helix DNA binding protein